MGLLNKITRFASSPQGRRAINSATSGGTRRGTRTTRRGATTSGGGGLGRLASSFLGGRRR